MGRKVKRKSTEKGSTLALKQALADIGEQLGFEVESEDKDTNALGYQTETDLVWYHRITDDYEIGPFFELLDGVVEPFDRIPIAGFEIEGSDPTSKDQISNVVNLGQRHIPFKFIVVDQAGSPEGNTYRRLVNIIHSMNAWFGHQQVLPLDASHLPALKAAVEDATMEPRTRASRLAGAPKRQGVGGESKATKEQYRAIAEAVSATTLEMRQDYKPPALKHLFAMQRALFEGLSPDSADDEALQFHLRRKRSMPPKTNRQTFDAFYYTPKIDIGYGFYLPQPMVAFLGAVASVIGPDAQLNPFVERIGAHAVDTRDLWTCLFGFELETSASKHGGAALVNLARNAIHGLVVTKAREKMQSKLNLYRTEFGGLGNVRVWEPE